MKENTDTQQNESHALGTPTCEEICKGEVDIDWLDPVASAESKSVPFISEEDLGYCCLGPAFDEEDLMTA